MANNIEPYIYKCAIVEMKRRTVYFSISNKVVLLRTKKGTIKCIYNCAPPFA